ncbi:MAG: response regulator [Idiomarina sp.]|nr:response regulator [Idiomarina sp.]
MTLPVLICDDSAMARKQMARSLPGDWDVAISFASNGIEAVAAVKAGQGDILFLDLNMPEMDGYEVLEAIRRDDLPTMVIVVSGDIQQPAYERVKALGAMDFIRKPANAEKISEILQRYGVVETPLAQSEDELHRFDGIHVELHEMMQEVVNIAMGEAGSRLSRMLDTFVELPVPKVRTLEFAQLPQQIAAHRYASLSGVTEGFTGNQITGEAILLIDEQSFSRLFNLFKYDQGLSKVSDLEVLMDLSSVITGACLQNIANQLDLQLSYSHPVMLGRKLSAQRLLRGNANKQQVLAVEVNYAIPEHGVECDLIIVFTEDSIDELRSRAGLL